MFRQLGAELAVIGFPDGCATLLETAEGVTVEGVIAATEAELAMSPKLSETRTSKARPDDIAMPSMGEAI